MGRSIRFGKVRFQSPSWAARAALSLALCAAFAGADRASAGPVNIPVGIPTISNVTVPKVSLPTVTVPKVSLPSVTVPKVSLPSVAVPTVGYAGIGDRYPSVSTARRALPQITVKSVVTLGGGNGGGIHQLKTTGYAGIGDRYPSVSTGPRALTQSQQDPATGGAAPMLPPAGAGAPSNAAGETRYYAPTSLSGNNTACGRYPLPPCH
jgi:hypothetical protein